jgi:hypothetical protein
MRPHKDELWTCFACIIPVERALSALGDRSSAKCPNTQGDQSDDSSRPRQETLHMGTSIAFINEYLGRIGSTFANPAAISLIRNAVAA